MDRVPSFDELMWPVIKALKETGGSASNDELLAKVTELAQISDGVASIPHKDGRQSRLSYNLAWARTYLKKVGALYNSKRGVWSLTEAGEKLSHSEMAGIPARVRSGYERRPPSVEELAAEIDDASSQIDAPQWRDHLLRTLQTLEPVAFERLAQRLLREAGFIKVEVTGRSGDGGIDGVGILRLNLLSFATLFQCKRYSGSVGAGAVRDFRGAMIGRSDKGLIITTGIFSQDAKREATRDGAPAIDLIDGDRLCSLLKEFKLGVDTEIVEHVSVNKEWFEQI